MLSSIIKLYDQHLKWYNIHNGYVPNTPAKQFKQKFTFKVNGRNQYLRYLRNFTNQVDHIVQIEMKTIFVYLNINSKEVISIAKEVIHNPCKNKNHETHMKIDNNTNNVLSPTIMADSSSEAPLHPMRSCLACSSNAYPICLMWETTTAVMLMRAQERPKTTSR